MLDTQSEVGDEMGSLGELQFSSKGEAIDGDSALGWRSEKPEAWPTDGPDCEADHLASYGVLNTMDLVRQANKFNVQCELNPTQGVNSIQFQWTFQQSS